MSTGTLDRNAATHEEHRRNWQRMVTGAATKTILVSSPLHNENDQIALGYVIGETPAGTINGTNPTFTLASTPLTGTLMLFVDGLLMQAGGSNDYTLSGTTITFNAGAIPQTGDWVKASYLK